MFSVNSLAIALRNISRDKGSSRSRSYPGRRDAIGRLASEGVGIRIFQMFGGHRNSPRVQHHSGVNEEIVDNSSRLMV